ncbi:hypothetical protein [Streptomyces sp. M92]|uniref:hypothetical protein n=1 Tax=Streptomyces sp. M92 TaxID=2944250 RepID=UPI00234B7D8A|nr:hypothetical protein [Streptomyces sp. M92]WCN05151.1 hypothetical protein M6G08_25270 [Streptomyces sp. M92]
MGDSRAYPLFRSVSAADTLVLAQRLWSLMERRAAVAELTAELQTVEDVWRMVGVLPRAQYTAQGVPFDSRQWTHEYRADTLPRGSRELLALLPLRVDEEVAVGEGLEDVFVQALGRGPASIYWDGNWPDGPELGLEAYATYEAVEVAFNSLDIDLVIPADEHTVFVHLSKLGNLPRAEWLARQLGVEVLGESVPGR